MLDLLVCVLNETPDLVEIGVNNLLIRLQLNIDGIVRLINLALKLNLLL